MKIGLAQIKPDRGNVMRNIQRHLKFINIAAQFKVDAVFFPELSLTGYEPKLAESLQMFIEDNRLDEFQQICELNNVIIGLGFPEKVLEGTRISMLLFQPSLPRQSYAKHYLHGDEIPYFICGNEQFLIKINDKRIAPAICFEALQVAHLETVLNLGAEVYLASVAKSAKGISNTHAYFAKISKKYKLPIFMVNSVGDCDNFLSAGSTAVWNESGVLMGKLDEFREGLLMVDLEAKEIMKHELVC